MINPELTHTATTYPGTCALTIRGNTFDLLGSRTAFWRERSTLLAADLHWGKVEVFQRHGIPVPRGVLTDDLARLTSAIELTQAKRLLILGDLIHATSGLTPDVVEEVSRWRESQNVYFHLIRGNHDKKLIVPLSWRIDEQSSQVSEDDFIFSHDEVKSETKQFVWNGHLHPMARLNGRGDSLRLPCFFVKKNCAQLPAFSFFTGGVDITMSKSDLVFVIADGQVIKL